MKRFDDRFVVGLIVLVGLCRCVQAETPSPAPLSDFFCQPLELQPIENEFFASSNRFCVFDCSIPMPFRKSARIEVVNDSDRKIDFFHLDKPASSLPDIQDAEIRTAGFATESSLGRKSDAGAAPP